MTRTFAAAAAFVLAAGSAFGLLVDGVAGRSAFAQSGFHARLNGGGWDGVKVPAGQQCKKFGGEGSTPPLLVSGIPAGTERLVVEFNDLDYEPLSKDGGHGVVAFAHGGGSTARLTSVKGGTATMPAGVTLVAATRAPGDFASPGYLPPCSGGRNHVYSATVKAEKAGAVLATTTVKLGAY